MRRLLGYGLQFLDFGLGLRNVRDVCFKVGFHFCVFACESGGLELLLDASEGALAHDGFGGYEGRDGTVVVDIRLKLEGETQTHFTASEVRDVVQRDFFDLQLESAMACEPTKRPL